MQAINFIVMLYQYTDIVMFSRSPFQHEGAGGGLEIPKYHLSLIYTDQRQARFSQVGTAEQPQTNKLFNLNVALVTTNQPTNNLSV
jgi:hypothetical protein